MEGVITRVLSHLRMIRLSKGACLYLEGQGMISIRKTSPEIFGWSSFNISLLDNKNSFTNAVIAIVKKTYANVL